MRSLTTHSSSLSTIETEGASAQPNKVHNETTTDARETDLLHIFFEMDDGSSVAFVDEPNEELRLEGRTRL